MAKLNITKLDDDALVTLIQEAQTELDNRVKIAKRDLLIEELDLVLSKLHSLGYTSLSIADNGQLLIE